MVKKLYETTNLSKEIMNSKRQVKRKLGRVVAVWRKPDTPIKVFTPINPKEQTFRKYSISYHENAVK